MQVPLFARISVQDHDTSDDNEIVQNTSANEDIGFIDIGKEGSSLESKSLDHNDLRDVIHA